MPFLKKKLWGSAGFFRLIDKHQTTTAVITIIVLGIIVYANSLAGEFILDGRLEIQENPQMTQFSSTRELLRGIERPLTYLTFAFNYSLGGFNVVGYHVVNVIIHILASLTLFGIIRRTLLSHRLFPVYHNKSLGHAWIIAVIWLVHPLQTESVTYIYQRAESLMGLFYLLTLYCSIRFLEGASRKWSGAAIFFCFLGMLSKPVMVTAPIMVLLYDRIFFGPAFQDILEKRRLLYLGLAATWLPLSIILKGIEKSSINITSLEYALTQPRVILHYLKLSFWPYPLVLDYQWPVAKSLIQIVPSLVILIALLCLIFGASKLQPGTGFLGIWFFLILGPTSSFKPLVDLVFEHRVYLSLAAVVALVVFAADHWLSKIPWSTAVKHYLSFFLVGTIIVSLSALTIQRNRDYRTASTMWRDVVTKRPENPRAHYNFGLTLLHTNKQQEAKWHFKEAYRLKPDYAKAYYSLGLVLIQQEQFNDAVDPLREAIRINPDFDQAYNNLGIVFLKQKKWVDAARYLAESVRIQPDNARAQNNLGVAFIEQGKYHDALNHFSKAVKLKPEFAKAHNNLGKAYLHTRRFQEAITHFRESLRLRPNKAEVQHNLGRALMEVGKFTDAEHHLSEAVRLDPGLKSMED